MKMKRIITVALTAFVALSAVGLASAQGAAQRPKGPRGEGERNGRHPIARGLWHVASAAAEASGLERADLIAHLAEGKTLAEIITENGGDITIVKNELLVPLQERAAAAVENGRITQKRADTLLARADKRIDHLLNHVFERLPQIYERRQDRRNPLDTKI